MLTFQGLLTDYPGDPRASTRDRLLEMDGEAARRCRRSHPARAELSSEVGLPGWAQAMIRAA